MIGILNTFHYDKDPETFQKDYAPMILKFFMESIPERDVKSYLVGQGEFPKSTSECEAWVISGSPMDAYSDIDWVKRLREFVKACHQEKRKMLGICFGHQLIAHALGGEAKKSEKGQGVGVRTFEVLKPKPWMQPELKDCSLLFFHQDQVMKLPAEAEVIAGDDFCPIQMYSIGDHIFCMQGHPEFCLEFTRGRIEVNREKLGQEQYTEAMNSLTSPTDHKTVGQWIYNFIK